jgi:polysaccharide export outer membrane protein
MISFRGILAFILAICLPCLGLAGCQTASALLKPFPEAVSPVAVANMPVAEVADTGSTVQQVLYQYQLGAGDKIRLIIFGEKDLGGEFVVSGAGTVSLPLIGDVKASGLTVTQLQDSIATSLGNGYLKSPRVSVEVLNFRPFYILGEVGKPGMYPYSSGLTVDNAVALGGGFTYRADKRRVFIKRENQAEETEVSLKGAVMVSPGDTIRIAERIF